MLKGNGVEREQTSSSSTGLFKSFAFFLIEIPAEN